MLKLLFKHPFVRYVISGGVAVVVEYGSFYSLFVGYKMALVLANALSFGFGLMTAFLLNRLWAFNSHEYSKKATHQFSFYVAGAIVNLLLTLLIVAGLKRLGLDPRVGKVIAMAITSSWNFVLLKLFVFNHTSA